MENLPKLHRNLKKKHQAHIQHTFLSLWSILFLLKFHKLNQSYHIYLDHQKKLEKLFFHSQQILLLDWLCLLLESLHIDKSLFLQLDLQQEKHMCHILLLFHSLQLPVSLYMSYDHDFLVQHPPHIIFLLTTCTSY